MKRANTLKLLPSRLASRIYGAVNSLPLPWALRPIAYASWGWAFKAKMHEVPLPLTSYPSLNAFFTRRYKAGVRPIDQNALLVSPVDSAVVATSSDLAKDGILKQVKGIDYRPEDFLGLATPPVLKPGNVLHAVTLYLSPGDHHRYYSPTEWTVTGRTHIAGQLLPVNPVVAHLLPSLLCTNERVALFGEWEHGFFSYTAVGATNVGSMRLSFEPELHTNTYVDDWKCGFSVNDALGLRPATLRVPALTQLGRVPLAQLPLPYLPAVMSAGVSAGVSGVASVGRTLVSSLSSLAAFNPLTFLAPQRKLERQVTQAAEAAARARSGSAASGAGAPAPTSAVAAAGDDDEPDLAPLKVKAPRVCGRRGHRSRRRASSDMSSVLAAPAAVPTSPVGAPSSGAGAMPAPPAGSPTAAAAAAAAAAAGVPFLPSAPICRRRTYPAPIPLRAGEEIGWFELGSTIVLVFEAPPDFAFSADVVPGAKVMVGRPITGAKRADASVPRADHPAAGAAATATPPGGAAAAADGSPLLSPVAAAALGAPLSAEWLRALAAAGAAVGAGSDAETEDGGSIRELREGEEGAPGEEEALGERGLPLSLEEQLAAFERDAAAHGGGSSSGEEGDGSAGEEGEDDEGEEGSPVSHGEAAAASGGEEGDAGSHDEEEEEGADDDAMTADFLSCCSLDEEEAAAMAELMREAALATATAEADLAAAACGGGLTGAKVQPEAVAASSGAEAHA